MDIQERLVEMKELNKKIIPCTTSVQIAYKFEKEHKNIIRDIENLIDTGKFSQLSFEPSTYVDSRNKKQKMYLLDEKLTTVLIMRMTGDKALEWQLEYVDAFQSMRTKLAQLSEKDSIRKIFEQQILGLPEEYTKEYSKEFWSHIYRLYKLDPKEYKTTPGFFGGFLRKYVWNDFCNSQGVVLEMLDEVNPRVISKSGNKYRKDCFYQYLDRENLLLQFRSHRDKVFGIMASSVNKYDFKNRWSMVFHSNDKLLCA